MFSVLNVTFMIVGDKSMVIDLAVVSKENGGLPRE